MFVKCIYPCAWNPRSILVFRNIRKKAEPNAIIIRFVGQHCIVFVIRHCLSTLCISGLWLCVSSEAGSLSNTSLIKNNTFSNSATYINADGMLAIKYMLARTTLPFLLVGIFFFICMWVRWHFDMFQTVKSVVCRKQCVVINNTKTQRLHKYLDNTYIYVFDMFMLNTRKHNNRYS